MNGHVRSESEDQQIHDAEAFELQGLISEEDLDSPITPRKLDDEENPLIHKENGRA